MDYEEIILIIQDSESCECATCEYKDNCKSQCMEERVIYNPNLK